jgi:hypothetical protein
MTPDRRVLLLDRYRFVEAELSKLDEDLQEIGERDLADAIKRARRELELVFRHGIPQERGV